MQLEDTQENREGNMNDQLDTILALIDEEELSVYKGDTNANI